MYVKKTPQFYISSLNRDCSTANQAPHSQGTLIGTIIDWATAQRPDRSAYLIPLGIVFVVPVIMTVAMFFIPESPRWLILQGRYEDGIKALERVRPSGVDVRVEADEIQAAIDKEKEAASGVGIWDMFRDPVDRRRTILSVCAVTLQAATGSMFIIGEFLHPALKHHEVAVSNNYAAYKAYFFTMANVDDPFAMTNVLSTLGLVAIITNSLIIVRWGRRRRMLISGLIGCAVLQLIIAIVYDKKSGSPDTGKVLVALSSLYLMSYNVSSATTQIPHVSWVS